EQNRSQVRQVVYYFAPEKSKLFRQIIFFYKGAKLKSQMIDYQEINTDYPRPKYLNARSFVLDNNNQLRNTFKGFTIEKQ
ncbi:MAG: hypothetical protein AAFU64_10120, partial [Bacteroidota bacterium]